MIGWRATCALGAAFGAVPGGAVLSAPSAQAATNCWDAHFTKLGYEAHYCNNVVGAPVGVGSTVVDHLRTNPSWFVCKIDNGPSNGEGSPHPNRWLWTYGDDHGNGGWVSDADISSETNPVPTC